jgi:hypothetical protein
MGPNPIQYLRMVAGDKLQEEIPPLEEDVQEEEDQRKITILRIRTKGMKIKEKCDVQHL